MVVDVVGVGGGGGVPVVADDNHGHDGAGAADGPQGAVHLAPQYSPHPVPLHRGS